MSADDGAWLTVSEAAALLGIRRETVYEAVRAGRLPARRSGRDWLVTRADVDAYAARRRPAPGR